MACRIITRARAQYNKRKIMYRMTTKISLYQISLCRLRQDTLILTTKKTMAKTRDRQVAASLQNDEFCQEEACLWCDRLDSGSNQSSTVQMRMLICASIVRICIKQFFFQGDVQNDINKKRYDT